MLHRAAPELRRRKRHGLCPVYRGLAWHIAQKDQTMNKTSSLAMLALLGALASPAPLLAQTSPSTAAPGTTRAQVKMERAEFLKSHRWDSATDTWVIRPGFEPPEGVKTRAEIKAERDEFLSKHRWDEARSDWVPRAGAPRVVSSVSRAQVKAETVQFMKTHRWDESKEEWVDRQAPKKRK
jgi:hypothetical protein